MKRIASALIIGALTAASATPAAATDIFGGIYKHDVKLPTDLSGVEKGWDFQVGLRGSRIGHTPLQPYVFGALNSAGDTSYVAAGLSAKFGGSIFIRPGLGIAVHTGSATKYDIPGNGKIEFGSRVLFEPELGVGMQVAPMVTAEASWVHMSHATLFGMGVLPLQFKEGEGSEELGLDGTESFAIRGVADLQPRQELQVEAKRADGSVTTFTVRCRIDTYNELEYFKAGGILHYVLRRLAA